MDSCFPLELLHSMILWRYCLPKVHLFFYSSDYILKNNCWKFCVPTAFRTSIRIYCFNLWKAN